MGIKNIFDLVKDKANKIAEEKNRYNDMVSRSLRFENMTKLEIKEKNENRGRVEDIMALCPNLTRDEAIYIYNAIPLWEVFLSIFVINEKVSGDKFYLIATNRWIWIINQYSYKIINYSDVYMLEVIKESLMTQVVNFNQIIINVNDYISNVRKFIEYVTNKEVRDNKVLEDSKYLCGIVPTYQYLNKIQSGISMDSNNNIVFHDRKKNNIRCTYDEIIDYEVLEDQTSVLKKKKDKDSHSIPFTKNTCTRISIRITLSDNRLFMISILEPSTFNSQYNHTDSIYMKNFKFAKDIIDLLEGLNNK